MNKRGMKGQPIGRRFKEDARTGRLVRWIRPRHPHCKPSPWWQDPETESALEGNGQCAKRLRRLVKKDRRKDKHMDWQGVKRELGNRLWKRGIIALSLVGKPRGVKNSKRAQPETIS